MKKLYKSNSDRMLFGVCGGIAEYLGCDSNIVRIVCVLVACMGGFGILAYLIAAIILPQSNIYIDKH